MSKCLISIKITNKYSLFKVYYIPYCNSLADMIGCKPRLSAMLLSDPLLALRCYFGPCSPPQYRLTGPGNWDGARQAIMEIHERNVAPMKKKSLGPNYRRYLVITGFLFCLCLVCLAFTALKWL